jgi:ATP-dependent RNA helicase
MHRRNNSDFNRDPNRRGGRLRKIDKYKNEGSGRYREKQESLAENYEFVNKIEGLTEYKEVKCTQCIIDNEKLDFDEFNKDNNGEGLKESLLEGIYAMGYEKPSKIQSLVMESIIKGKDVIAQSQSGTGKTASFVIPSLQIVDEEIDAPQVIIISPTVELAAQTMEVGTKLGKKMNIKFSYSVGKKSRDKNVEEITGSEGECCKIISGTPGRLEDLVKNYEECFSNIKLVILDECDNLLSVSFGDTLYSLLKLLFGLSKKLQICLFSATFRKDVFLLSQKLLTEPSMIFLKQEKITLDGIKQRFITVREESMKMDVLTKILSVINISQLIVYANTKVKCEDIRKHLVEELYDEKSDDALVMHGDLEKGERYEILNKFKNGKVKCLISTDLLSRGIDVQQLSLIINYELPNRKNFESYVHRIGRTGRYGKEGFSINLVTNQEETDIQSALELYCKCEINPFTPEELQEINTC